MSALTAINKRVKALQKKHPKTKRTTLQKQAGREYRNGKLSGSKKRKRVTGPKKRTHKRVGAVRRSPVSKSHKDGVDSKRVDITIGSVSHHLSSASKALKQEIAWNEVAKLSAKNKTAKRKIQQKINDKKVLLRKISK